MNGQGVESVLGNSNVLNRKIEESISVGKEFHPISELWSKFERIMVASGIPDLYPRSAVSEAKAAGEGEKEAGSPAGGKPVSPTGGGVEGEGGEGIRFELTQTALPPGVAPGGGRIYA